jgi:Uncharacterized conserved protein
MAKQRRDAAEQFIQGDRQDLADIELAEVEILKDFLPEPLSEAELNRLIESVIAETGATGAQQMGQVMGVLKPKVQGRAEMQTVSQRVKQHLS